MDKEYLTEPLKKLYGCVSKGLGSIMIPKDVKKIFDNQAKEIQMISTDNNMEIMVTDITYDSELDEKEVNQLYRKTCSRMLYQEMIKQKNIDNIVDNAKNILQDEESVSDTEVDNDWLLRFFNSIQDISNNDMQLLWGKILAGEIKSPNSFSLRTLEKMKSISSIEANLFTSLSKFIIDYRGTLGILNDEEINKKNNIRYKMILELEECGLIDSSALISINMTVKDSINFESAYGSKLLIAKSKDEVVINIPIYKLTKTGNEIYKIINKTFDNEYIIDVADYISKKNSGITVSLHNIIEYLPDGVIRYELPGRIIGANQVQPVIRD